ncbi:hypothetical protein [Liquorilactobacillus capillatus]|uniref:Uncharacterized protein n=1 Tax=Liquorilactobacillus capillatus DSM 19910 TaxID=1423731 RepID=A0A0R1M700_9LACO|nr:hypothetical protein [Liquorilactobacillus capillatus]KRL01396.1 hypothetical protein FC81_GL001541 [Liquorilactobacillus capillatus DSM 19910]
MRFFILIILLIIVLLIFFISKRILRQKALTILQAKNKKITDKAVSNSLAQLSTEWLDDYSSEINNSRLLASIWGKGVTVFEYILPAQKATKKELEQFRQNLNAQLALYAQKNSIFHFEKTPAFLISDLWFLTSSIHIEVACISNQQTLDYLGDIDKLEG